MIIFLLWLSHAVVALTITSRTPSPNTQNTPVNTNITIIFDEPVDAATVNANTFSINGAISGYQTATSTVTGNTITLNPNRDFQFGELITITLTTGIKSITASALTAASTWQLFTATLLSPNHFSWLPEHALGNSNSRSVALGDLDQDGDLDALVANSNAQANRVWFNDSFGNFVDSGQTLGTLRSFEVALADLDQDGDLDAFIANQGNEPSTVWLNNGNGIFTDSGQNLLIGSPDSFGVAVGDLDNDGDLDAFIVNWGANKVWLNDGSATFTPTLANIGTADSYAVALGDIDQDGDLDAVIANDNGFNNKLWLNDGSGNFTDSGQNLGTDASYGVALGDVDNDGDLEIVFANKGANTVWLNNGSGFLADSDQTLGTTERSFAVALGDVDGDGDLDAFFANGAAATSQVWVNNGNGIFTNSNQFFEPTDNSWGVALGDIDDDGDLDAVIANEDKANKVHWNGYTQIRILTRTPLEDAVEIPVDSPITVQFNRDLDTTTLNNSSFTVSGSRSDTVTGLFNKSDNTLIFYPQNYFQAEEHITVTATLAIQSSSGHILYQPQNWSFYITTEPDPLEEDDDDEFPLIDIDGLTPLPPTMNLSMLITGSGAGQVKIEPSGIHCSTSCTHTVKTARWVTLIPQAAPGARFQFWGGDLDCHTGELYMIRNYNCHAYFEAIYPLHVTREGEGTITVSPEGINCQQARCRYFFSADTEVKLTPIPAAGWQFQYWQGQCDPQGQVLMTTEQQCRAIFTQSPPVSPEPPKIPDIPNNPVDTPVVAPSIPNPPELPLNDPPNAPVTPSIPEIPPQNPPKLPAADIPPEFPPPCPLIKGSTIDFICNAEGGMGEDITIGPDGKVSNIVLMGDIQNHGWLSNLVLQDNSHLNGGILTGYIDNQGLISNIDFRGKNLMGGTLAGTIINNSEIGGCLTDIHLAADTFVISGKVAGTITSDGGAQLADLVIAADSHLEQVILAEDVELEGPVDLAPSVDRSALLTQDHLNSPALLASLHAEDIAQLPVETFTTLQAHQLSDLSEDALTGMNIEQFQALPATALSGLTINNLGGLSTEIIQNLTPNHLAQLSPQAFAGLTAEQLGHINPDTLTTMTITQFNQLPPNTLGGLTSNNIKGLSTDVVAEFTSEHLQALEPEAFKQQSIQDMSNFLIYLNAKHINPQETERLLPPNWQVNPENGQLIPPSGTQLTLKPKTPLKQSTTVELPQVPDLDTAFSVGSRGPSVREGIGRALAQVESKYADLSPENNDTLELTQVDLSNFILSQEDSGILRVEGTGQDKDIRFAFIPDMDNMIQVNEDEIPIGLSQDEGGFYLITTPDKQQFRVIPAPKDPLALSALLGGRQVKIGSQGDVLLHYSAELLHRAKGAQQPLAVMFDPLVQQPPKEYCRRIAQEKFKCDFSQAPLQPGIHLDTDEGRIVYRDGSAQRIRPTVLSPQTFIQAGLKVAPGIEKIVYRSDGGFDLFYSGQKYLITFDFNVHTRILAPNEPPPPHFSQEAGQFKYHIIEDPLASVRRVLSFQLLITANSVHDNFAQASVRRVLSFQLLITANSVHDNFAQ